MPGYSGTLAERRAKRNKSAAALRSRATPAQKAKRAAAMKAWRVKNAVEVRAYKDAWNAANPEKAKGYVRAAYAKYKDRYNAGKYERDIAGYKARAGKRRARLLQAMPPWLTGAQLDSIDEWYRLATSLGQVVDHIVPLQGETVSGLHVPWNLQLLTDAVNRSKGNRMTEAAYQ